MSDEKKQTAIEYINEISNDLKRSAVLAPSFLNYIRNVMIDVMIIKEKHYEEVLSKTAKERQDFEKLANQYKTELDAAWAAAKVPVRTLGVSLAEVIENILADPPEAKPEPKKVAHFEIYEDYNSYKHVLAWYPDGTAALSDEGCLGRKFLKYEDAQAAAKAEFPRAHEYNER